MSPKLIVEGMTDPQGCGTVWYKALEALGPGKIAEESDETAREEAEIYEALGKHYRILNFLALEVADIYEGMEPKAWASRFERAPHGPLRDCISVILVAEKMDKCPNDWYGCKVRCCPPGSDTPNNHTVSTMNPEASQDEVVAALVDGKLPEFTSDNPAEAIVCGGWEYKYKIISSGPRGFATA
ncbi:hypothetical protein AJ78_04022 [Emergomyces pasteurianus Ep9510]|uniref:Uncharacterized protein n=1 Tax=Emergomyces pasteurianus Ep9510 TaxID=1447872 RepID=A0A1J9QKP2_9EURO|nr:hypothetical protein AJ78_04022 [Emergomyces pasteurianus Ep9510]